MRGAPRHLIVFVAAMLIASACAPDITSTAPSGSPAAVPSASEAAGASGSPIPGASGSAAPSLVPSPSAVPTPSAGPGGIAVIPPGSAIEVAVAELNLRRRPTTSATRIEVLRRGQILVVSPYDGVWFAAGPVKKDGYTWYPVMKLQTGDDEGNLPALPARPILIGTEVEIGWIATDNGERSYVKALPPRCPTTVDLRNVEAMLSAERLACFGGPIVLEGTYGCPACGAELLGDFDPLWLTYPQSLDFLSANAPAEIGPLVLRFAPDGPDAPPQGANVRVTVHVDDPAAIGCRITLEGLAPTPAATAELFCREQLVVDSFEFLGMDPDFNS